MKKSRISKVALVNLVVLLLMTAMVEMAMRINGKKPFPGKRPDIVVVPGGKYFQPDSVLGYRHLPGTFSVTIKNEYTFVTQHDASGLRITAPPGQDTSARPEIWLFGCSFTHGWSVNDNETFAWLLQEALPHYQVINHGVSGYGTIHFYLKLKEALRRANSPALVIVNHADFHFYRNTYSFRQRRNASRWNFLGHLDQPYALLDENDGLKISRSEFEYRPWMLSRFSALAFYLEVMYESRLDDGNKAAEMEITRRLLDDMLTLCRERNIPFVLTNLGTDADFARVYSTERKIPFVNLSVDLKKTGATNRPYDDHPSAKTHAAYAENLITFLEKNVLRDSLHVADR